ncbi:MAP kinase kinase kinase mkh1 [Hypsizygus marmoreus]|uniref:MAP kinase kinase kinase mkh1 n=1 Tax=Hypsizygus marmoreus TaxID=39966 RepID=A0A369K7B9_HYPMA|nr:MAP kinase kinase kinase mkh1 [Hypsizygus marmoreus]
MSEDARTKGRTRYLYVANPGSDSDSEDDSRRNNLTAQPIYLSNPLRPNRPPQKPHPSYHHPPTPLTTNLPSNHPPYHPSSHPSSSSPSSTSSPAAEESTPPPSTPGLPVPPVDLSSDGPSIHDPAIVSHANDRPVVEAPHIPISRKGNKILQTLKSPFRAQHSRGMVDVPPKRPRTSPTVSTPDSVTSLSSNATVSGKVLIVVTTDSDWYVTVDISGARNAAVVRECIFNKLNIYDDEQLRFSIYQTEMGAYAIGDALTDEKLFALCRDHGDSKGSLKFFVSHSSAPVHEHPMRSHSPTATTIPPPVLPYHDNPMPLRPKRRSRQESVSSTSEQHPLETSAGYDADLDNPDRGSHKPIMQSHSSHPLPSPPQQQYSGSSFPSPSNPPPSPRTARRPSGQPPRPMSPLLRPPKSNTPPASHDNSRPDPNVLDSRQFPSPPPPPPLSPNRPTFMPDESSMLLPSNRGLHDRSGSDAGAEREMALRATEQQYESASRQWRNRQHHALGGRLRAEQSRESLSPQKEPRRRRLPNDVEDQIGRSEPWVLVPSVNNRNDQELSPPVQELTRPSASIPRPAPRQQTSPRHKVTSPYTGRSLALPSAPRQPPPTIPVTSNETRTSAPRPAGVPISSKFVVTWRGEERGEQKAMPTSSTQWSRLTKGTKSMDNLRAAAYNNHPPTLQPGRRATPQLPMTRPTVNVREPMPFSLSSPGVPKSYEPPRQPVRPLPVHGSAHGGNPDSSQNVYGGRGTYYSPGLVSPNMEPYPRPQSAFGDSMTSPTRRSQRQLQSPTYSGIDSTESLRSPRGVSPSRSYQTTHLSGSKLEASYGNRSDRSSDAQSGAETSYTTPPHTPISPRSPLYPGREKNAAAPKSTATTEPQVDGTNETHRSSESTLKQEDQKWFSTLISQTTEATLIPSRVSENDQDFTSQPPSLPSSSSEMSQSTFLNQFEEESDSGGDDFGTSMWKKRPMAESERPKSILRPPLKVQIEPSTAPQQEKSSHTSTQTSQHTTFAPPPPSRRPLTPPKAQKRGPSKSEKGSRGSTFTDRQSTTWAPRPPPEDVYERLEEFFPEHDLDKPVIEANSGGTSPTTAETVPVPIPPVPVPEKARIRGKKSIRIVAEEHKKLIDRTSRGDPSSYSNVIRKRSTKLWGSRLEEVTTAQAKIQSGSSAPESPSGGPTTFKWVRGELIGRGTYGRVYLALNATTGEMIAVKQVEMPRTASDKNDSRQITVVQALKMESETLKDLDHPNIVQYLGFEETPANLSIFLEYVPGGSIGSCLLKHGKFDEDVTKSFTGQILSGLEYLHSKGILHRDLKADNILVEMSGVCKISDFGISKRTDDAGGGAFTAMQGTVFWMAPEVINTQKKGYNFKIDIWSVGCVVLEMWAGMRPWMGDEAVAVMFKLYQSKLPPPVPEDVVLSELADDFRRKCFAINPEERPTAAELRNHPYLILPPDWVFTDFK